MSAWVKQFEFQVKKLGAKKASWYTVWYEPDGTRRSKSHGPGPDGKRRAKMLADQIKAQLTLGQYEKGKPDRTTWSEFVEKYRTDHLSTKSPNTQAAALYSLEAFARVLELDRRSVSYVTTERVDRFKALRLAEKGHKPGSTVSPATVNKDLRHVQAALRKAVKWKYLAELPEFMFVEEPKHQKRFITEGHFVDIYRTAEVAQQPQEDLPYSPADWWRGLLMFACCTGWRIGELLSLEWEDVSLDEGYAITRAEKNKGNRDESVHLASVVVEHLRPLVTDHEPLVFPWQFSRRKLYNEFARIQKAAGIDLPCKTRGKHSCTDACHLYSFHDERRAFATLNADRLTKDELRRLMRHKSGATTDRYISYSEAVKPKPVNVHVPAIPERH